jgi:hypothetical protein
MSRASHPVAGLEGPRLSSAISRSTWARRGPRRSLPATHPHNEVLARRGDKGRGLALDPLNTADELCAQAKAKGCLVDNWHGELDDGTAYVGFEIRPPSGARFMPDVRCPVPLLLLRRVHLAQARRKESVIFYNHIEARRRGGPIVYMSTVNLTHRKGFNPGDYIQWDKGV